MKMLSFKKILLTVFVISVFSGCTKGMTTNTPLLNTVSDVDISKYLGTWHAVARIPNRFEKDCLQSKAEYSLNSDGTLGVTNSCPTKEGKTLKVIGKAWVSSESNAKLKVGFFKILGWYPEFARGDYWIIGLGPLDAEKNYSYSVVGEPSRKYGWILSRNTSLEKASLDEAFEILEKEHYERKNFVNLSELDIK
jgi:apolipoprotein D and lipocalin family protein